VLIFSVDFINDISKEGR